MQSEKGLVWNGKSLRSTEGTPEKLTVGGIFFENNNDYPPNILKVISKG